MGGDKTKILCIDDIQDNLITLKALIKDTFPHALTYTALSGASGLELAAVEDPDVILLDIVMPVMDGFEVCKKLKTDNKLSNIPVVFITAQKGDKESRIRAMDVGADAFIAKPIDENELTAQIRAMVKIKRANIENAKEKERLAGLVVEQNFDLRKAHLATLNLLEDLKAEIEARKKNEEALKKSEEDLADIFQTVTEGIGYASLSGEIISINASLEKIIDIQKERIIGRNALVLVKEFLTLENSKKLFSVLAKLIQGKSIGSFQWEYRDKILEITATVNMKSRRIVGVLRDITQKDRAEKELQKSEERFRTLIENAFDGIYLTNGEKYFYVNNKFCEIIGYNREEITSPDFNIDVILSEESKKIVHERDRLRRQKKETPGTFEFQIIAKDGKQKFVEVSTVNIALGDVVNVMGIVREITERKKLESRMIQSERLSALGEMSAGMAHEINQPLNTLSILFDNILFEAKNSHSVGEEYLLAKSDKIYNNILRIRNLIDHVRDFSRSQDDYILSPFNINESILNALSMIYEQFKIRGINLITHFDKTIPDILGNTFKFEQIILNLILNSKDALLDKKKMLAEENQMFVKITTRKDGQFITIEVEDNGTGIKPEHIDKILQPFYTTKETGKGTGLGLSITYGLIKEMNGNIDIKSEVLKGTTVSIKLPLKTENN